MAVDRYPPPPIPTVYEPSPFSRLDRLARCMDGIGEAFMYRQMDRETLADIGAFVRGKLREQIRIGELPPWVNPSDVEIWSDRGTLTLTPRGTLHRWVLGAPAGFIAQCAAFEPGDGKAFQALLSAGIATTEAIAAHMEVAPSTVDRWACGRGMPQEHVQKATVRFLKRWALGE